MHSSNRYCQSRNKEQDIDDVIDHLSTDKVIDYQRTNRCQPGKGDEVPVLATGGSAVDGECSIKHSCVGFEEVGHVAILNNFSSKFFTSLEEN